VLKAENECKKAISFPMSNGRQYARDHFQETNYDGSHRHLQPLAQPAAAPLFLNHSSAPAHITTSNEPPVFYMGHSSTASGIRRSHSESFHMGRGILALQSQNQHPEAIEQKRSLQKDLQAFAQLDLQESDRRRQVLLHPTPELEQATHTYPFNPKSSVQLGGSLNAGRMQYEVSDPKNREKTMDQSWPRQDGRLRDFFGQVRHTNVDRAREYQIQLGKDLAKSPAADQKSRV
jgi:hypothetical protein